MEQPAAFGYHPVTGLPYSHNAKLAAGLLSIFFGYSGAGRFYAGHTGLGFAMLVVDIVLTVVSLGMWLFVAWIWPSSTASSSWQGNRRTRTDFP